MRVAQNREQLILVIVNTFNLLLGKSQASEVFWQTVVQLQLRAKFGSYGEVFDASAVSYRDQTDLAMLFQRLTAVLGISFPGFPTSGQELLERLERPNP